MRDCLDELLATLKLAIEKGYEIEVRTHWFNHFYINAVPAKTERIRTP